MATMFDPAHSGSILKETLSYLKIRRRDSSWSLYQYLGSNAVKF